MDFDWSSESQHGPMQRYPPNAEEGPGTAAMEPPLNPNPNTETVKRTPGTSTSTVDGSSQVQRATPLKPNPNPSTDPTRQMERGRDGQMTQRPLTRTDPGADSTPETSTNTTRKRKDAPKEANITGDKRTRDEQHQVHQQAKRQATTRQSRSDGTPHGNKKTGNREGKPRAGEG